MKKKARSTSTRPVNTNHTQQTIPKSADEPVGDVLAENTVFDVFVSPTGSVVELTDTVDAMDGAKTEVIDIINEADGTNIELTRIEEPTDRPGVDSVDRFIEIKGIGPQVADLLAQAGIRRFSALAETSVERLREILSAAGSHYRIYDPATWPHQAKQLADSQLKAINYATNQRL